MNKNIYIVANNIIRQVTTKMTVFTGETIFVHDEQREHHFGPTALVTGTQLFGQMRGRVHSDRRTDQDLRLSGVLRVAAVQRVQRIRPPPVRSVVRRLSGVLVLALENYYNCRRSAAVVVVETTVRRHVLFHFHVTISIPLVVRHWTLDSKNQYIFYISIVEPIYIAVRRFRHIVGRFFFLKPT